MRVDTLSIENLRNVGEARLAPGPGLNLLFGDNGAGKTTVLEALLILAKGRSFRSGLQANLIGPRMDRYRVVTEIHDDDGQPHRIGMERDRQGWRGRMDGADLQQVSETADYFPLILMEPNSHRLVSDGPDYRRRYLDWSVFHVKQGFLERWRRYARALKQRNAALRTGDRALVESMDPQVVALGEALDAERRAVFELLAPEVDEMLERMTSGRGAFDMEYRPGWGTERLADALEAHRSRDLEQGVTRDGPHRADISIKMGGRAVRDRLSRGEQKIVSAALLLAQARLFRKDGRTPLVLLDDLASEFDVEHLRRAVELALALDAQLFVTGTEATPYDFVPIESKRLFHVKQGEIRQGEGS